MLNIHDYYYQEPEGYQGNVPLDPDYKEGVRLSTTASSYKAQLVKLYNKLAKQLGMRHDWTSKDI